MKLELNSVYYPFGSPVVVDECEGYPVLQFRLTYAGPLMASGNRGSNRQKHKQEIRKVFHRQLKTLWETNPYLQKAYFTDRRTNVIHPRILLKDKLADEYSRVGYSFVPLVTESLRLICDIDILYLRESKPGQVINKGDIDNRLKTLFDAFKMPDQKDHLGGYIEPSKGEEPFFCLLEDDELISNVSVQTDYLLEPSNQVLKVQNDSRLVIKVSLRPFDIGWDNISFG